ncbi:MAG: ABC transporter [Gammaproteobacteria bacterium]|nr:ABC transporter [Gammaproteobacteria bacterium]MBQ0840522.1 ABC transporter [Gammaproteobacteria bacterium]
MFKESYQSAIRFAKIGIDVIRTKNISNDDKRNIARRALALQFSDARGVMMKIGQLFAASSDDNNFDTLVKGIPPVPLATMEAVIEDALGAQLNAVFADIEESTNAASLGQVHRAQLLNGAPVAVKIQYPDIAARVDAEMALIGLMPGVGPVKKWGFDLASYKTAFKSNMDRELDYLHEAKIQQRFQQQVDVLGLVVPNVYPQYSRSQLLVQSWEYGDFIDDIGHWPHRDRQRAGEIILGTLFKSLFDIGLVHGDPHLGNSYFRYAKTGQPEVVLMDYGCTIEISENQRLALLKLILATTDNLPLSPLRYFAALGFEADKLAKIGDALPMLCRLLFKPFADSGLFSTLNWQLESSVNHLLGERRWWFRSAGPAELLLILRAFQGITQQLALLKTTVCWSKILQQNVSEATLQQARAFELPMLAEEHELHTKTLNSLANTLHVTVKKQGRKTANITLPAEMVLDLENIIPEDVLAILSNQKNIDITAIKDRIMASGIAPQNVFSINSGDKEYSVWLA